MTSSAPRPKVERPEAIGPYRILDAVGAGGMGVVYRARHLTSGQVVALKTVQAQGEAVLAGIRREIHALRSLDHPGVVRIVADGLAHGVPWYAMELLDGPTLRRFHRERSATASREGTGAAHTTSSTGTATTLRGAASAQRLQGADARSSDGVGPGGLPMLRESLSALRAVCRTLAFVHGRGVVHRDLKPDNVILTGDRGPVLVDFGIAAAGLGARGREVLHSSGRAMGSPGYMAPEQVLGEIVDARADLYAIGCMLFEAITGRLPFDGESTLNVLARKLHEEAPSVRSQAPGVPDALERLVARLLSRRPQDRIGHADDIAAALGALGADFATPPGPPAEPYLYRPGLAGRGETVAAIERILTAASVSRVTEADASVPGAGADSGAFPLGFTAAPTLDVTSGRDLAAGRRGGFVLVGGESGVGKTRLALEITAVAAQRGFRVVTGQCERVGAGVEGPSALRAAPLHPLGDLFHAIADRCRAGGRPGYQAVLGARGPVLAAFEPSLADLDGHAEQPPLAELLPDAARTRLHEALSETLRAFAATEPLLLVLDDLQWADEHTLGFLRWLDEAWFDGSPVVVLATYRLEEVSTELAALLGRRGVRIERLARLDERAVARIVRDMLAVDAPDRELVGYLHRHTDGNPFFVAEYLRTAIDQRLLLRDDAGRWCIDVAATSSGALERLPLPSTLADLVALRLEGLEESALEMARMLAVLGREAHASVLADALGSGASLSPEGMLELLVGDIVDEPQPDVVRFVHDKLREVLYARLPSTERALLHRRAARALAAFAEARGELDRVAPELAHHHAQAGDVHRALGYLDQAAERAMATGAASDALRSFQLAARLFDDEASSAIRRALGDRRVRWERRAAEAHHALGDLRAAEVRGRSALRLASGGDTLLDVPFEEGGATRARFAVGAAWAVGRQLAGLARSPAGARVSAGDARWREAALAAEKLAQTYLFLNDASRAGLASVLATNYAARFGSCPELARGHAQLAIASAYLPSDRLARAYVARADRIAREVADPETNCSVDFMCGYASMGAGRFDACFARVEAALQRARVLVDRRREEEALALLAMAATFQGRFDEALARYAELDGSARRTHNAQGKMWAQGGRAMVWARLGRIEETIAAFDAVGALIEETADQSERIQVGLSAVLHLLRGDRARARAVAERTLLLLEAAPPAGSQVLPGVEGTATALLALWTSAPPGPERRSLEALATRAVASVERFARLFPIGAPDALRLRAGWLAAHGRLRTVDGLLRRSIAEAARLGMPIEEGRARVALAARLDRPERDEQLRIGRELLRTARAHLYLRGDMCC